MVVRILQATLLEWLILLVAVTLLLWGIVRIRVWFREDEDPAARPHEMLAQFRELQRQGDLTEEEFRLIKGRIIKQDSEAAGKKTDHR